MKAFDIGWEPEGWKRGDPLRVQQCRRTTGMVGDKIVETTTTLALVVWAKDVPYGGYIPPIACVKVGMDESEKCNRWLDWWRAE